MGCSSFWAYSHPHRHREDGVGEPGLLFDGLPGTSASPNAYHEATREGHPGAAEPWAENIKWHPYPPSPPTVCSFSGGWRSDLPDGVRELGAQKPQSPRSPPAGAPLLAQADGLVLKAERDQTLVQLSRMQREARKAWGYWGVYEMV